MAPTLYILWGSPPVRAVLLTAKALGVDLELKEMDFQKKAYQEDWFKKMNPCSFVPTLDDNGFYLWESRAIMTYLADQYGKDDTLYPKDNKKRALVDQMLNFDLSTIYLPIRLCVREIIFRKTEPDQPKIAKVHERLALFNTILERTPYAAGSHMTIADLALIATVTMMEALGFDYSQHKNVHRWAQIIKQEAPDYEKANQKGLTYITNYIQSVREEMKTQSSSN